MGWGRKDLQASSVGAGPFSADYNRNYDTHTAHTSNQEFAVNPPDIADVGPYQFSGLGPDKEARAYRSPLSMSPDVLHGSPYGYLGDTIGPREIQTGNAPSGGYTTLPGLGFAANQRGVVGVVPDQRRANPRNRSDDWEDNQANIHQQRDAELTYRRSLNVSENWSERDQLPVPGHNGGLSANINAIEDSPYRRDWSDGHAQGGGAGSATHNTNPNKFRNMDAFDRDSSYRSRTRYMNGTHFSMAEHKSLNPYTNQVNGGSSVQQVKRNTYYMTPQPWDTTSTDGPANVAGYDTTTSLAGGNFSSSYRL